MGAVLALTACGSGSGSDPIAWWRQLEGGRLAEERPAPPNADAPYPNLASVPSRPVTIDTATRARIATGLGADQRDAAFAASQPIVPPTTRRTTPGAVAGAATQAGGIGASLAAASAPATPPAPPAASAPAMAPVLAGRSVPRSAPRFPPGPAGVAQGATTPALAAPPTIAEAALTLPATPPTPPRLPGVAAATTATPALRAPPPATPQAAPFIPGAPVGIAFAAGSAVLPEGALAALRRLGGSRAGHAIWAVGYGESATADAAGQAATLALAFARARAIASALAQSGVPPDAIRLTGEAIGRGGVARIAGGGVARIAD